MGNLHKPYGSYERFFKRPLDFVLALCALILLLPVLLILTITGAIALKGNPYFVQKRPGRIENRTGKEKIFSLIKFRTMTNEKDQNGNLLPNEQRMVRYGRILRATSMDELPELLNILKGDMSLVGPRPLRVKYLPLYNAEGRPIWKPMHMQPIYRMNAFVTTEGSGRGRSNAYIAGTGTDVGADIFRRGLCLPSDNKMTAEEQNIVIEIIHNCFK